MAVQVIKLTRDDDIVTICDQLSWVMERGRVVILTPKRHSLLDNWVTMARLRRQADRLQLEVGLVTRHPAEKHLARQLGIPVFTSLEQVYTHEQNWRTGRRQLVSAGLTQAEMVDLRTPPPLALPVPNWQKWGRRYAGVVGVVLALTALVWGVIYAVPGAVITLHPYTEPIQAEKLLIADPAASQVSFTTDTIPGRRLTVRETWQAQIATTGFADVADAPARGEVIVTNITTNTVTIPAGTLLLTSDNLSFQLSAGVDLPAVLGSTAAVEAVAVESGPVGNIGNNQLTQIAEPFNDQVTVRNPAAFTGGAIRSVPAVTQADLDRLTAQVTQYLQTLALGQMQATLTSDEFLAEGSLVIAQTYHTQFSHQVGEATERVSLEIEAEVQGTAVNTRLAFDLMYQELAKLARPGYALVPESFLFYAGEVVGVDAQGRVQFEMIGEGVLAAELDVNQPLPHIAGQPIDLSLTYLYEQLPLRQEPTAQVLPNWFGRLPYAPGRITVVVDVGK